MALGVRRLRKALGPRAVDGAPDVAAPQLICLACGAALTLSLANGGALRCHDCRSTKAPLDGDLLELQRVLSGRQRPVQ